MLNKLQASSLIVSALVVSTLAYEIQKRQQNSVDYSIDRSISYPILESKTFLTNNYEWLDDLSFSGDAIAGDMSFDRELISIDLDL